MDDAKTVHVLGIDKQAISGVAKNMLDKNDSLIEFNP